MILFTEYPSSCLAITSPNSRILENISIIISREQKLTVCRSKDFSTAIHRLSIDKKGLVGRDQIKLIYGKGEDSENSVVIDILETMTQ